MHSLTSAFSKGADAAKKMTQAVLDRVGYGEETVDSEFDQLVAEFMHLDASMKKFAEDVHKYSRNALDMNSTAINLSRHLRQHYDQHDLELCAVKFYQTQDEIEDVHLYKFTDTLATRVVAPITEEVKSNAEIKKKLEARKTKRVDYDRLRHKYHHDTRPETLHRIEETKQDFETIQHELIGILEQRIAVRSRLMDQCFAALMQTQVEYYDSVTTQYSQLRPEVAKVNKFASAPPPRPTKTPSKEKTASPQHSPATTVNNGHVGGPPRDLTPPRKEAKPAPSTSAAPAAKPQLQKKASFDLIGFGDPTPQQQQQQQQPQQQPQQPKPQQQSPQAQPAPLQRKKSVDLMFDFDSPSTAPAAAPVQQQQQQQPSDVDFLNSFSQPAPPAVAQPSQSAAQQSMDDLFGVFSTPAQSTPVQPAQPTPKQQPQQQQPPPQRQQPQKPQPSPQQRSPQPPATASPPVKVTPQKTPVTQDLMFGDDWGVAPSSTSHEIDPNEPAERAAARAKREQETKDRMNDKLDELRRREEEEAAHAEEAATIDDRVNQRVIQWAGPKHARKNIRALMGTLNDVLWEDNNWTAISMSQLIAPDAVKKAYRKAVIQVHPDKMKQADVGKQLLASKVFDVLQVQYDKFRIQENVT